MKKIFGLLAVLFLINSSVFAETVYPKPVVVTFYRPDCEVCGQIDSVKREMIEEYGDRVNFVKINMDIQDCDFEKLAQRYNIQTVPTTMFLNSKYGITKKTTGYIPKKLYVKQIEAISLD